MIINHGVRGSIPTSGPFTVKYGGSTPCVEILTKNVQIIFDCGSGFSKVKINDTKPTIILLSHFHHDHLQGLPFNPTLYSSKEPILVACAHKSKLETKEIIKQSFSPPFFPFDLLNLTNNVKVVEFKDIVSEFKLYNFSSFSLIHPGESSGYSLNDQDKKFCYLLDNEFNKTQKNNLIKFCENSDFIIWDGMFTENELKTKKCWGHSSVEQGLKFAEDLDLKKLIISHHAPDRTDEQINKISAKYKNSNLIFAQENKEISFYGKT